jgi:hypothetical protein
MRFKLQATPHLARRRDKSHAAPVTPPLSFATEDGRAQGRATQGMDKYPARQLGGEHGFERTSIG